MHEQGSQLRSLLGDKGQRLSQVVFAHGGLEIGKRLVLGLWMACAPVHEEADDQPAEHAQDPQRVGAADPAAVIIEGDIQALMGAIFNAPSLSVGFEPLRSGELRGTQVGDEADGFILASDMLPGQQGDLGGEGEPDVFRGDGLADQGAAFGNPPILFEGAGLAGGRLQRGKNPWVGRERFWRCSGAGWAGCSLRSSSNALRVP